MVLIDGDVIRAAESDEERLIFEVSDDAPKPTCIRSFTTCRVYASRTAPAPR